MIHFGNFLDDDLCSPDKLQRDPQSVRSPYRDHLRGHKYAVVHDFCRELSGAPRNGRPTRRDDADWLRFAFAEPDDADAFQARFGGRRLTAAKSNGRWQYTVISKPAS